MLAHLLLGVAQVIGLLMIPMRLPGVWLQVASVVLFGWWMGFGEFGVIPSLIMVALALCAELTNLIIGEGPGGPVDRRPGFMALGAGCAAAVIGYWIPLPGSLFGGVIGASLGGVVGLVRAPAGQRARVARALPGMTMKVATGVAVAVSSVLIVYTGPR